MEKIIAIYQIKSNINNKIYIGSSIDVFLRWKTHIYKLKSNKHGNKKLQNYFNKYGIEKLSFSILEIIMFKEDLIKREQYYINTLNPFFNICVIAGSPMLGRKHSKETISKMQKKHFSEETKIKMSISKIGNKNNLGNHQTKETIEKRTKQYRGRKRTDEAKIRIGNGHKGKGKGLEHLQYIKDNINNKTQNELAKELNIHQSTISKILKRCT